MEATACTHQAIYAHRAENALETFNLVVKMHLEFESCINYVIMLLVRKKNERSFFFCTVGFPSCSSDF